MHAIHKAAALSVLAISGISAANASIIAPGDAGGSELVLSIVNNTTNDSISIDLNAQAGAIALGDSFALSAEAQNFIASAGGLGEISYGVISGEAVNFSSANFLTSSTIDLSTKNVANATRGTWLNSVNGFIGNLNAGGSQADNTYGPFSDAIGSPNYRAGGHDVWQTGDPQLSNLALGTETQALFQYSLVGFAGFTTAELQFNEIALSESSLSIVPVPAAVWLMGSALMGLFGAARRNALVAGLVALKDRMSLRAVDLI